MEISLTKLFIDWTVPLPALGVSIGVSASGLLMTLLNVMSAPRLERFKANVAPEHLPRVSLLIPFRDELENLRETLPLLSNLNYPNLEILLLNDFSTDGGERMARAWSEMHPDRSRVIDGTTLPSGWLGKNWACAQLAKEAKGDILIFCDADVRIGSGAILETVGGFFGLKCDALTAMPFQTMRNLAEKAIIPIVMHLSIFSLLPLKWLPQLRSQSATFANGQWLAFTRSAYVKIGGHDSVRAQPLEDVGLARRAGMAGLAISPVLAVTSLQVQMYRGVSALVNGFSKNLAPLAGGHPLAVIAVTLWITLAWLMPLLSPAGIGILVAQRLLLSRTFRYPWGTSFLHPVGVAGTVFLLWYSASLRWFKLRVLWKGRPV